jgi:hypothetical protein
MRTNQLAWALLAGVASLGCLLGCRASGEAPSHHLADDLRAADAGDAGPNGGLPCDVEQLLSTRCQGCHSAHPSAPMPLLTYADLAAPSKSDPTKRVYTLALERMKSTARPMPPSAPLGASDLGAFEAWIQAGATNSSCVTEVAEGGAHDAGLPECVFASDCPGDLICRNGTCDVECVTSKDCTPTWTCEETRCHPPRP